MTLKYKLIDEDFNDRFRSLQNLKLLSFRLALASNPGPRHLDVKISFCHPSEYRHGDESVKEKIVIFRIPDVEHYKIERNKNDISGMEFDGFEIIPFNESQAFVLLSTDRNRKLITPYDKVTSAHFYAIGSPIEYCLVE